MPEIKKIKLNNGAIYSIMDNGALRLDENGRLITGNTVVDKVILEGNLFVTEINDVPISDSITNVLVQDEATGEIKKRSIDLLLEDSGGVSAAVTSSHILKLKIGK